MAFQSTTKLSNNNNKKSKLFTKGNFRVKHHQGKREVTNVKTGNCIGNNIANKADDCMTAPVGKSIRANAVLI